MGELSKETASLILADGTIKGKPLTEKQIVFFTSVVDGTRVDKEKKQKNIDFDKLEFL